MFVPSRALNGNRRHRLVTGVLLTLLTLVIAVGLTATAVSVAADTWSLIGFGSAALSVYTVVWWSVRYTYAAFSEGRPSRTVAEPHPWPWLLPMLVICVAFTVLGVGSVQAGKTPAAVFSFVLAALMLLPGAIVVVTLINRRERQAREEEAAARARAAAQEARQPFRAWGSID
ncbi:hypothetical protein [Streptomyces cavernicola]|uniref:Amino acid permease n=1 Tax=Streptomyces cavernicola TaxID=3043613 RepID=A0ABT6SH89_9ACTN|nr:hypothetical protein [Streptomyces sp. B-S-A6]MDI3407032.1 hypothetical protein [Streptomyces sp. B-S-A6]